MYEGIEGLIKASILHMYGYSVQKPSMTERIYNVINVISHVLGVEKS